MQQDPQGGQGEAFQQSGFAGAAKGRQGSRRAGRRRKDGAEERNARR